MRFAAGIGGPGDLALRKDMAGIAHERRAGARDQRVLAGPRGTDDQYEAASRLPFRHDQR